VNVGTRSEAEELWLDFWMVRESLTFRPAVGLAKHINPIYWVGGLSTVVKWLRHETDHLIPFSPGVRNEWTCTSTPLHSNHQLSV
jgi:hypothetical protein